MPEIFKGKSVKQETIVPGMNWPGTIASPTMFSKTVAIIATSPLILKPRMETQVLDCATRHQLAIRTRLFRSIFQGQNVRKS